MGKCSSQNIFNYVNLTSLSTPEVISATVKLSIDESGLETATFLLLGQCHTTRLRSPLTARYNWNQANAIIDG